MVSAIRGCLITCDPQLKEIIKALNNAEEPENRFIIADIAENCYFIKSEKAPYLKDKVVTVGTGQQYPIEKMEQVELGDIKMVIYGALTIQEERAAAYKEFDTAFKRSCASQEDDAFREAIARVTPVFQDLSNKMQGLEKHCNEELGRPDVAYVLRQIQNKEREKLRLTTEIQALKRSGLMEQEDQIGGDEVVECSCHAMLPSGQEVRSAVAEGYQELEQCIIDINSFIEELYYLKMDT